MLTIADDKKKEDEINSTSEKILHFSEQNESVGNSHHQDQVLVSISQEEILFLPEKNKEEKFSLTQKKEIKDLSTHPSITDENLAIENLQKLIVNLSLTIIYLEEKKEQQGMDVSEMISMLKKEEEILSKELKIKKDKENKLKEAASKASQRNMIDHEIQELSQKLFEVLNKKYIDYSEIETILLKLQQKKVYLIYLRDENGKTPESILWEKGYNFFVPIFRKHDDAIDKARKESIPQKLYQAVDNSQLANVKQFISECPEGTLDYPYLLNMAFSRGEEGLALVEYFVEEKKVDLNALGYRGSTPLYIFASHGNLEGIQYLLQYGADLTREGATLNGIAYKTLLHAAIQHLPILNYFLQGNPPKFHVDVQDYDGQTLLHRAVEFGLPEVVSKLLDYRPDLLIKDRDGQTVLDLANQNKPYFSPYESEENLKIINQSRKEARKRILAYVEVQKKKETILQKIDTAKDKIANLANMGLEDADIPILEEILTNNPTLIKLDLSNNHFTEKGILKLQGILSEKTKVIFVELSGISITSTLQKSIQDELSSETRLLAMLNGHELDTESTMDWPYIQTLCQYATEINQRSESTNWQWTHVAVRANQWEVVKLLVQKGMKLSGINDPKEKQTLLHLACIHGTEEYVKWLAEQYADALFQENAKGETPLHLTIIFNKFENFKVLLSFKFMSSHILSRIGADALLKLSIQHRRVNCVQFLLAHGIQILPDHLEIVNEEDTSKEATLIKQLLSTQIEKQKLLFQAINANNMSDMEKLINEGVCINALDEQGHTPFYYAVKLKHPQLVAFLLHHGADRSSAASLETFSEEEINQIGQSGLDYLQKSSRAIIGYLNYHTYSAKQTISTTEQTCSPFSMENVYEALYAPDRMDALLEIKYFRPIMEIMEFSQHIKISYDPIFTTTRRIDCYGEGTTRGTTDIVRGEIFLGGKDNFKDLVGTTIHELTHFCCQNIWGNRANPYAGYDIIIEYPENLVGYESILKNFETQISATSRGLFIFHPVDKKWEVFRKPVNQDAQRVILPENSAELYKELDKISSMEEAQKRKELIKEKSKNIIFTSEAKALAIAFEHEKLFRDVIDELHQKYGLREEFKKKKNFIELAKISIHELFCETFELYTPENYHSELIARAIQIIAKHGKEGLEILKTQTPRLFDFIETIFIPRCLDYLNSKKKPDSQNYLIRTGLQMSQWTVFERAQNIEIIQTSVENKLIPTIESQPQNSNPMVFMPTPKGQPTTPLLKLASVKPMVAVNFATRMLADEFLVSNQMKKTIIEDEETSQFMIMLSTKEYDLLTEEGGAAKLFNEINVPKVNLKN